ncbi:MAG: PQQ-binding-like beta-propeller repeat protein [Gammaproteobacteria bacterium]|nr:PQQ-binding-like beta-propeller repeat protein [Gammaproteobacteria bacterium]MBT5116917.1 PQQ-binding-like beta-propeller repeat protein [Gammaproteobacteria bacterium]MBT5761205.1 PQQ-binding-like beta-propeller repeat protein [Gammaproteobacteria bacterium]MBT6331351.1 PQQ-binding-like beta-propeller repeat protein [Gammaproteobacteria bacterium]MBT7322811.1 PQQ-binding-like beta-propeller repeat protein [Gammaproteobacteria bacterium]
MSNPLSYFDLINSHKEFQNVNVKLLWSIDIGEDRNYKTGTLQPAFLDNTSYTIDSEGLVTAIDLLSGNIKWIYDLDLNVSSGLSIHKDILFFGTSDGKYYGYKIDSLSSSYGFLDRLDITSLIRDSSADPDVLVQLVSEVSSPGLGIDNLIFVKLDDGDTVAINIDNSNIEWQYKGRNVPLSMKGSGSIAKLNNNLFIARDDGNLISLRMKTGKLNWLMSISPRSGRNELESLRDIEMTPYVKDGVLFVGSFQGNLISVDALTGNLIWSIPMSVLSNIDIDNNYVYIADSNGSIFALDRFSGFTKWKLDLDDNLVGTQSFSYNKYIINISTKGHVMVINKSDGQLMTSLSLINDVDNQVKGLLLDKTLYIHSKDGRLNAIKID